MKWYNNKYSVWIEFSPQTRGSATKTETSLQNKVEKELDTRDRDKLAARD